MFTSSDDNNLKAAMVSDPSTVDFDSVDELHARFRDAMIRNELYLHENRLFESYLQRQVQLIKLKPKRVCVRIYIYVCVCVMMYVPVCVLVLNTHFSISLNTTG